MYLPYDKSGLWVDGIILALLAVLESFRLLEGQKGNLTHHQGRISLAVSLGLTVPSAIAVIYFAAWQNYVLRLEIILCIVQLIMQVLQFVIGIGVLVGR
jgi:transmembrane protein 216